MIAPPVSFLGGHHGAWPGALPRGFVMAEVDKPVTFFVKTVSQTFQVHIRLADRLLIA